MNAPQKLIAELMKLSSFNSFNGERVVNLLEKNSHLWRAFDWGRFGHSPLISLRDMEEGVYNADTLFILPAEGKEQDLELLVLREFEADEVDWMPPEKAGDLLGEYSPRTRKDRALLRVWWD